MMADSCTSLCTLIICLAIGTKDVIAKPSIGQQSTATPNEVNIKEFPWQAAVISTANDGDFPCGAAIISERHLITSSDCIKHSTPGIMHVTVGSSVFDKGVKYQLKSTHTHPNHTGSFPFLHDIAVVEIDGKIEFDENKSSIDLPEEDVRLPPGTVVTLAGWGYKFYATFSENLKKQDLTILPNSECDAIREKNMTDGSRMERPSNCSQLYARPIPNTVYCQGNMGTGVVYEKKLVGIAVMGTPCGASLPEFITRVYDYVDWIRKIIDN